MAEPYLLPLGAVLIGWAVAGGSPGPATLAISGTAMGLGRRAALALAAGVLTGSAIWGVAAAVGLSAVMMSSVWAFQAVRLAGALYLFVLALKSARSAWRGGAVAPPRVASGRLYVKGVALHLTNPKAVLSWGAVYALAVAPGAGPGAVWGLFGALIAVSALVFFGYAVLFALPPLARGYARARRGFEAAFAVLFGAASLKLLTLRLG